MKNVYIEYSSASYRQLFLRAGWNVVSDIEKANLICFTGGADVSPYLYGEPPHNTTHNDAVRDRKEESVFRWALARKIPMVGICRGGQFLNVMSGGKMYQNVDMHGMVHDLLDRESRQHILVTSTHHQMMRPQGKYQLLGVSYQSGDREFFTNEIFAKEVSKEDNEVVYYPDTNCLCFQPHPEMYLEDGLFDPMRTYFFNLIENYLNV
jgi:anthranilate/para-aminobenzoate synthase component II